MNNKKLSRAGKSFGFSITEVLIVVIIIAVIAAFALPSYQKTISDVETNNDNLDDLKDSAMDSIAEVRGEKVNQGTDTP